MQVTETLNEGLKRALEITVPADDLDGRLTSKLDTLKGRLQLKGFRPGKVPAAHIRKMYGKQVMAEVLEEVIDESSTRVLTERGERPAFTPDIKLADEESAIEKMLAGGSDLAYRMEFEVLPEIELTDVTKIEIERPTMEIEAEELEKTLESLAREAQPFHVRDEAQPAQEGDRVSLSYVGKIDGEPFVNGTDENASLVLGSGTLLPQFEQAISGHKTGEAFTIDVTFPDDYGVAELDGMQATFDIVIKEIAAPGEMAIDDELAKQFGLEDLQALRTAIAQRYQEELNQSVRQNFKRLVLDELDKRHTFELPPTLVASEFNSMWKQMCAEMENAGETFEDAGTTEEKVKKEYQAIAERRIRLGLVLGEIGRNANISVSDEELKAAIDQQIHQNPVHGKAMWEHYRKNPQALDALRMPLYEEKVVNYLSELMTITDRKMSREEFDNYIAQQDAKASQIIEGEDENKDSSSDLAIAEKAT